MPNPVLLESADASVELQSHFERTDPVWKFWADHARIRDADPEFASHLVASNANASGLDALVLREAGVIVAMLVGRRELDAPAAKLAYVRVPMPRLRTFLAPKGGWIGEIDDRRAELLVRAATKLLERGQIDCLTLHLIDLSSPLARAALTIPDSLSRDRSTTAESHYVLRLKPEGGFLDNVSGNERGQQRKRQRKLAEAYANVRIDAYRGAGDIDALMRCAEGVAAKSYQRGLGVGFFDNAAIRSRLEFFAAQDWLRAFVLVLDDKSAAFWIGTLRAGCFTSDYLAFDPEFSAHAPGVYLMFCAASMLADEKIAPMRELDFGGGYATYKERLGNQVSQIGTVRIYARNGRGAFVNAVNSGVVRANESLKSTVSKSHFLAGAKRSWRNFLGRAR